MSILSVQNTVSRCLCKMLGRDVSLPIQICYGAGNLDNAVTRTCRKVKSVYDFFKQHFSFLVKPAMLIQYLLIHSGIAEYAFSCKTLSLDLSGFHDSS